MLRGWRSRGKLREPAAARVWLLRIATNLHRDHCRGGADDRSRSWRSRSTRRPPVSGRLEQRECVERALAALDELPPRQRQAMHLVTIEQLSHAEAADVLEISA